MPRIQSRVILAIAGGLLLLGGGARAVELRWYGQSMVSLRSASGDLVVIDPFDESFGYRLPDLTAQIVLVTHGHPDHSNVEGLGGDPRIFREARSAEIGGLRVRAVSTFHDDVRGFDSGANLVWVVEMDGLRIAHLGDLGHALSPDQLEQLRGVDICFVPVGGTYTLGPAGATEVIEQLASAIVVPIHFKTPEFALDLPLETVEPFLAGKTRVTRPPSAIFEVTAATLPEEQTILVLPYD
jgi:L-ascorbate metabolism protein UlaG (beta-lactamase superfamily)